MYYRYVTKSTSVINEVMSDLALLICGGDINSCSNSCDKIQSKLLANSIPSGWSMVDTYVGPNGTSFTVGAMDADNRTTKYVNVLTTAVGSATTYLCEAWDATAHTGTNAKNSPQSGPSYSATSALTYFILAQKTVLAILSGAVNFQPVLILEMARETPSLQDANYPVHISPDLNSASLMGQMAVASPRVKNEFGTGDVIASTPLVFGIPCVPDLVSTWVRDANELPYYPIYPVWALQRTGANVNSPTTTTGMVAMGRVLDFYVTTPTIGNTVDEFTDGTDTYVLIATALNSTGAGAQRYAVKKG